MGKDARRHRFTLATKACSCAAAPYRPWQQDTTRGGRPDVILCDPDFGRM
jgi:hypothetical protein